MSKQPAPSKTPGKTPGKADAAAPKKRSLAKLAVLILAPLLLAGGGFAGWTQYAGARAGDEEGHPAVVAVPLEIAAETSFTHSFALSVLLAKQCGAVSVPALREASEKEAHADGMLVNLSWVAAARRVEVLTEQSCGMLRSEINAAEAKADRVAQSFPEPGHKPAH